MNHELTLLNQQIAQAKVTTDSYLQIYTFTLTSFFLQDTGHQKIPD